MQNVKSPLPIRTLIFVYYSYVLIILIGYLLFRYAAWGAENHGLNSFQTAFLFASGYDPASFGYSDIGIYAAATFLPLLFLVLMIITVRKRLLVETIAVVMVGLYQPVGFLFHLLQITTLGLMMLPSSRHYFKAEHPQD